MVRSGSVSTGLMPTVICGAATLTGALPPGPLTCALAVVVGEIPTAPRTRRTAPKRSKKLMKTRGSKKAENFGDFFMVFSRGRLHGDEEMRRQVVAKAHPLTENSLTR